MRSSRLLRVMLLLEHGRAATAQALADDLGVSVRTVYRDVSALGSAGVPLWTESGPGGGIRLLDGWKSRLTGMTDAETSALMLLGMPSVASDLGLADAIAAAENKLLGALPGPLRDNARLWRDRVHVDAPGWFSAPASAQLVPMLFDAVLHDAALEIVHRGERKSVGPLGLVAKASVWYLVAVRGTRILSYRVDRIDGVELSGDQFARPDGFDLASWWSRSRADFDRSILRFSCRVRLSPQALRALPSVVGEVSVPGVIDGPDDDGWTELELHLETEEVALGQLIGLGAGMEVLDPPSLRAALRDLATDVAARHS